MNGKTAKIIRKLTVAAPHRERRGVKRLWARQTHEVKGKLRRRMALEVRSPGVELTQDGPLVLCERHVQRVRGC